MTKILTPEILAKIEKLGLTNTLVFDGNKANSRHIEHLVSLGHSIPEDLLNSIKALPNDIEYQIYEYTNILEGSVHPRNIIFPDSLNRNLPKETKILKGERIQSIYYDNYDFDTETFSKPVVKVDYVFVRDEKGLLKYKERTITWAFKSGNWSPEVQYDVIPMTSTSEKLNEIKRRRSNIVEETKSLAEKLGILSATLDVFSKYDREVSRYINAGSADLANAIISDTEFGWLDGPTITNPKVNIRQFLYSYFIIGT